MTHKDRGTDTGTQGDNRQTNRERRENTGLNTQGVIKRHTEKGRKTNKDRKWEVKQYRIIGSLTWNRKLKKNTNH